MCRYVLVRPFIHILVLKTTQTLTSYYLSMIFIKYECLNDFVNCINYFSLKINYDQDFCSNVEVMQSHCFLIDQGYDATPLFSDLLLQTN